MTPSTQLLSVDGAAPATNQPPDLTSSTRKGIAPAAGAVVGTSVLVLLVELARSGALEQYKDILAPLIGWGPGLLVLIGFLWLAHSYAPPLIDSQRATALALQKLADTVAHSANGQHDLVLAMQVNSEKLEQLRGTVRELDERVTDLHLQQRKEEWRNARTQ
jgi:hypothetical protein